MVHRHLFGMELSTLSFVFFELCDLLVYQQKSLFYVEDLHKGCAALRILTACHQFAAGMPIGKQGCAVYLLQISAHLVREQTRSVYGDLASLS